MRNAIAYRVSRDYCDYGATGLYVVQRQDPIDLNWKSCAWYGVGGYELKGEC